MKLHLSIVLALLAGTSLRAQESIPATPAAVQPAGFQVVKIKLSPPQAGDPKTVCAKALVGRGRIAGGEYVLVFDGAKDDGDLDVLRLIPPAPAAASEHKLMRAGPKAYVVPDNAFFLPGRSDLIFEDFKCYPEQGVFQAKMRIVKALKAVCDFKGAKVEVVVSDKNHNDRLGDLGSYPCDKDGYPTGISFSPDDRDLVQVADQAWIPSRELSVNLGQPFVLDDSLWTLGLVDGQVVPKAYECQTTEIRWLGDETLKPALMIVSRSFGVNRLNSKGRWLLPADEYRYVGYSYQQGEARVICRCEVNTEAWQEMQTVASGGKVSEREKSAYKIGYKVVRLEAGRSRGLGPVKSAVARAEAAPMTPDRKIVFSLKMVSPDGYSVEYYSGPWFQAKPKPGLRILDAAGKEIHQAEFSSAFGDCTWQVPADLKGTFTAELILTEEKPPFPVTVGKTAFTL